MRSNQPGALDGVYFHLELQVLLRFLLVTGMAFGTLAAYFVIVAEWFAKSANDNNDLRKLVPLYFLGGAIYASSVLQHCRSTGLSSPGLA